MISMNIYDFEVSIGLSWCIPLEVVLDSTLWPVLSTFRAWKNARMTSLLLIAAIGNSVASISHHS